MATKSSCPFLEALSCTPGPARTSCLQLRGPPCWDPWQAHSLQSGGECLPAKAHFASRVSDTGLVKVAKSRKLQTAERELTHNQPGSGPPTSDYSWITQASGLTQWPPETGTCPGHGDKDAMLSTGEAGASFPMLCTGDSSLPCPAALPTWTLLPPYPVHSEGHKVRMLVPFSEPHLCSSQSQAAQE